MKIICLGDSLTYAYLLPREKAWPRLLEELCGQKVINLGINGDTTNGMLVRFNSDKEIEKARIMIVMGGVNDFFSSLSANQAFNNLKTIIAHANYKGIKIYLMTVPRLLETEDYLYMEKFKEINRKIDRLRELTFEHKNFENFEIIDLYSYFQKEKFSEEDYLDGLHFNEKTNEKIAEFVYEQLKEKIYRKLE